MQLSILAGCPNKISVPKSCMTIIFEISILEGVFVPITAAFISYFVIPATFKGDLLAPIAEHITDSIGMPARLKKNRNNSLLHSLHQLDIKC